MKREIKFRAKRSDTGEWVYGDLAHAVRITGEWDVPYVPCVRIANYDVYEDTIGQCIGAKDKNRQPIYEGDIVTLIGDIYQVCYDKYLCAFVLCDKDVDIWERIADDCPQHTAKDLEIIGNIHDNPELMEGKEADDETE